MKADIHFIRIKPSKSGWQDAWDDDDEKRVRRDRAKVRRWERKQKGRDLSREERV